MKKLMTILTSLLVAVIAYFAVDHSKSDSSKLEGKVVAVADGDTFTLLTNDSRQVRIRLHGVDCPEKNQAYGSKAKEFASSIIFGRQVEVEEKDKDRYGRIVGIARTQDGRNLNELLLENGYAWHYKQYDKSEHYAMLEQQARQARRGLWADANPTPPWDFRKGGSKNADNTTTSTQQQPVKGEKVLVCSGSKVYHAPGCSMLSRCKSSEELSVDEAVKKGCRPCKTCH